MRNPKQFFHILSYLQYPLMLAALWFAIKPYLMRHELTEGIASLNSMLIFLGLTISFASLQDPAKTSWKFEKKIWENPKKARGYFIYVLLLSLAVLGFGIFGYFFTGIEAIKGLSIGAIVLAIGFTGYIKTVAEIFESHRKEDDTL